MKMPLKRNQPDTCSPIKTVVQPCPLGARKCLYRTFRKLNCNHAIESRVTIRKLIRAVGSGCPKVTPSVELCRHAVVIHQPHLHCHYDINSGHWSRCNRHTKKRKRVLHLKKWQPHRCPLTKTIEEFCKIVTFPMPHLRCDYDTTSGRWSKCNPATNMRKKVIKLKQSQSHACPPRKTVEQSCKVVVIHENPLHCRYDYTTGVWSQCNPLTEKRKKVLELKSGQPDRCPPTKTIEEACRMVSFPEYQVQCRYDTTSGNWSKCNSSTKKRKKVLNLVKGQSERCAPTKTVEESCTVVSFPKPNLRCLYNTTSGSWSKCNATTKRRKKVINLKKGQASSCPLMKTIEQSCTIVSFSKPQLRCRYEITSGNWSKCNPITKKRKKVLNLLKGQSDRCPPTKTVEEACTVVSFPKPNLRCVYNTSSGSWSKCNATTKRRKKVINLEKGQAGSCPPTKILEEACTVVSFSKPQVQCHYDTTTGNWSKCNPITKKRKKVLNLVKDQSNRCPPTKTLEETCTIVSFPKPNLQCLYNTTSGTWSKCNSTTNRRKKVLNLATGQAGSCPPTKIIEQACIVVNFPKPQLQCHYNTTSGNWSKCNPITKKRNMVLKLLKDQSDRCPPTKTVEEVCTVVSFPKPNLRCVYNTTSGSWSKCNATTKRRKKVLDLEKGQASSCPLTKTIEETCSVVNFPKPQLGCRYDTASGNWSLCNSTTHKRKKILILEKGQSDSCPRTKTIEEPCTVVAFPKPRLQCRYDATSSSWSKCNASTNIKKKVLILEKGQSRRCPATKTIIQKCTIVSFPKPQLRCHYDTTSGNWSKCNPTTKKRKKVLNLVEGQSDKCPPTKTVEETCRVVSYPIPNLRCLYDATSGTWSKCDPITKRRKKVLNLQKGQSARCPPTKSIEDSCILVNLPHPQLQCRYDITSGSWSKCNPSTKKRKKVLNLEKAQPARCPPTKTVEEPCSVVSFTKTKLRCLYNTTSGSWSKCNTTTKKRKKVLNLETGQSFKCPATKTIEESCTIVSFPKPQMQCRYDITTGSWSKCNPITKKREKVLNLEKGQSDRCPPTKTLKEACTVVSFPKPELRCLYNTESGTWTKCDPITKKRTKLLNLKKGQSGRCPPTKKIEESCVVVSFPKPQLRCRYDTTSGNWSKCNPITKTRKRMLNLEKGQSDRCPPKKTIVEACILGAAHKHKCIYEHRFAKFSECDPATHSMIKVMPLQHGQPKSCSPTKTIKRRCSTGQTQMQMHKCQYERKFAKVSNCDPTTHTKIMVMPLKHGQPKYCSQTKAIKRGCITGHVHKRKCQYEDKFANFSKCDPATHSMIKVMLLKPGQPKYCSPTKTIKRHCSSQYNRNQEVKIHRCHYDIGRIFNCNATTGIAIVAKMLQNDSHRDCPVLIKFDKHCDAHSNASLRRLYYSRRSPCFYTFSNWSLCDPATNTRSIALSFDEGDLRVCGRMKNVTTPCARICKYSRTVVYPCDKKRSIRKFVRNLLAGSHTDCPPTLESKRHCGVFMKGGIQLLHFKRKDSVCLYRAGRWMPCHPLDRFRLLKLTLLNGQPNICKRKRFIRWRCDAGEGIR